MKSQLLMSACGILAGYVAAVPAEADLASGNLSVLRRAGNWMARFISRRREKLDESHLQRLSDHLLKDIGLERSELHHRITRAGRRQA